MRENTAHVYILHMESEPVLRPADVSRKGRDLLAYAVCDSFGVGIKGFREDGAGTGDGLVLISKGPHGKPYFPELPHIHFNISHSGSVVVCVTAACEVGIDVQEEREKNLVSIAKRVFPEDQFREFLRSSEQKEVFYRTWTEKEAYVKWTGEGLSRDFRDLPMDGWRTSVHVGPGYACTLQSGRELQVECKTVQTLC